MYFCTPTDYDFLNVVVPSFGYFWASCVCRAYPTSLADNSAINKSKSSQGLRGLWDTSS